MGVDKDTVKIGGCLAGVEQMQIDGAVFLVHVSVRHLQYL